MALPLAAIAAAVTTAAIQGMRDRAGTGIAVRKTGLTASGQIAASVIGGAAAGATQASVENIIQGAINNALGGSRGSAAATIRDTGITGGSRSLINSIVPGAALAGRPIMKVGRRYRRTNVGNIKALRRAGRRLTAFVKLAKQMVSLEQRARIKKRRRR